ncbi:phosphoglycerate mutase-like protein [Leptomonas pyrrhocoris]|uniref:Serine/threonine-protein phosphatase PGAM5, mitochondrial n=1 Tax=Leptomonas pyrrhocoris TaxID=157538 RepID=A0A0N0DW89_LEPPY|nr:phosphoglycerate mutase-like protein [Leptomonas pyrrhocoris]XP_015659881.1 phosphoglycerate mutase-like protein [Leptomonas pyrrhocoris]KPA81441.1 phosphoglycerate mutase-like protein [Leptomonas pyrrhocoris]KPA81442.1 phosphoglycerate mutase-like protein [Leptomonas pyrrhocoris]|eukprot:XP_015659880.1 phosphoglycerate mutase-like protein [Leptomonas pyrrhocoris]
MAFTLRRFCCSVAFGFTASPFIRGAGVAFCESVSTPSPSTSSGSFFSRFTSKSDSDYVRTWGVKWVEDWDRPAVRGIRDDRSSSIQRQIILIRHGQYESETQDDDSIRCLTPLGVKQARATGVYLQKLFQESGRRKEAAAAYRAARLAYKQIKLDDVPDDAVDAAMRRMEAASVAYRSAGGIFVDGAPRQVYVSNLTRAKQTADLLLEAFPSALKKSVKVDSALRERFPCDVEPKRSHVATAENMKAAEEVFERYFHRPTSDESSVEIIVGHANVIRYLTMRALQLPPEAWLRTSLPHCSVTTITIRGTGHVSLVGMGSYGHLPPELVTTSNLP